MPPKHRYFSENDLETGVTASQLKRLSKVRQHEYALNWFSQYYEDPANQTPYESAEGGYQFIWGGPYDSRDELESEFSGVR